MTYNLFDQLVEKLVSHGITSPRMEAGFLIEHAGRNGVDIWNLLNQRLKSMPIDKIIGKKAFYKHEFVVNSHVLSPRPDTEILVEEAIKIAQGESFTSLLDLGTGSGCIILSILGDCRGLKGVAIDKSIDALDIAKLNAKNLNLEDRVEFRHQDWFENEIKDSFDLIVSNPPYIPSEDIKNLDKEVKDYDPLLALDGGADGLDSYKKIAEFAPKILNDGGYILLEVGIGQAEAVAKLFQHQGLRLMNAVKDLAGIYRCVILKK